MAGSLNKVMLIGNLGRDPETRSLNSGGKVVTFSMACSESWTDKQSGERREKTEWINVVVFNEGIGRVAAKYLKKGSKVYVEGKYTTRKWQDQEGKDRYSTEVVLGPFNAALVLLGDKGSKDDGGGESGGGYERRDDRPAPAAARPSYEEELDDEIPF